MKISEKEDFILMNFIFTLLGFSFGLFLGLIFDLLGII